MIFHNEIVILGDSFCRNRHDLTDWPFILANKLTGDLKTPRGEGFAGASWWSVRKQLLAELTKEKIKLLILCHTEPYRIPSEYDFGINHSSAARGSCAKPIANIKYFTPEVITASKLYYENLFFYEFHEWAQAQWFNEVDNIVVQNNIEKTIHLHCFNNGNYIFKNGCTFQGSLIDYAVENEGLRSTFKNHFSFERNQKLAEQLYQTVINWHTTSKIIDLDIK